MWAGGEGQDKVAAVASTSQKMTRRCTRKRENALSVGSVQYLLRSPVSRYAPGCAAGTECIVYVTGGGKDAR